MAIGTLQETLSIETFWEELIFTEERLRGTRWPRNLLRRSRSCSRGSGRCGTGSLRLARGGVCAGCGGGGRRSPG